MRGTGKITRFFHRIQLWVVDSLTEKAVLLGCESDEPCLCRLHRIGSSREYHFVFQFLIVFLEFSCYWSCVVWRWVNPLGVNRGHFDPMFCNVNATMMIVSHWIRARPRVDKLHTKTWRKSLPCYISSTDSSQVFLCRFLRRTSGSSSVIPFFHSVHEPQ